MCLRKPNVQKLKLTGQEILAGQGELGYTDYLPRQDCTRRQTPRLIVSYYRLAGLLAHNGQHDCWQICLPFPSRLALTRLAQWDARQMRCLQLRGQPKHYTSFPLNPESEPRCSSQTTAISKALHTNKRVCAQNAMAELSGRRRDLTLTIPYAYH